MKSASKSQGGFISQGMANDNYLKSTVSYDTGMNENGWATSFYFLIGKEMDIWMELKVLVKTISFYWIQNE